jgi:hypothetical protein
MCSDSIPARDSETAKRVWAEERSEPYQSFLFQHSVATIFAVKPISPLRPAGSLWHVVGARLSVELMFNEQTKSSLTIMTTMDSMSSIINIVLDILSAPSMQISLWRWEMQMIAKYGFDWGYREPWERP